MASVQAKRFFRESDYPDYWTWKIREAHYEDVHLNFFVESLEIREGDKVLEIGTGEGRLIPRVVEKGVSYMGIDISDRILKKARDRISKSIQKHVDLVVADAENLPFCACHFDKTFCFATFFFIPNKKKALKEISRVTRGAVLIDFRNALNPGELRTYVWHQALARSHRIIRLVLERPSFRNIIVKLFGSHRVSGLKKSFRMSVQPLYLTTPFELHLLYRKVRMKISHIWGIGSSKLQTSKGQHQFTRREIRFGNKWTKPVLIVKASCLHQKTSRTG